MTLWPSWLSPLSAPGMAAVPPVQGPQPTLRGCPGCCWLVLGVFPEVRGAGVGHPGHWWPSVMTSLEVLVRAPPARRAAGLGTQGEPVWGVSDQGSVDKPAGATRGWCLSVGNRNQLGPTQPVGLPPPLLRPAFLGSQSSPEHRASREEPAAGLESPGVGSSTPRCAAPSAARCPFGRCPRAVLAEDGQRDTLPGLHFLRWEIWRQTVARKR